MYRVQVRNALNLFFLFVVNFSAVQVMFLLLVANSLALPPRKEVERVEQKSISKTKDLPIPVFKVYFKFERSANIFCKAFTKNCSY